MQRRGLRFWGLVSAAAHVGALLLGLLFHLPRPLEEPREQGIAVELVAALPAQQAPGEQAAPVAAPADVAPPPTPEPPAPEPVREQIPTPPPPPPPPPPASAPTPAPQAQVVPPTPTPPAPVPPAPLPTPPAPTPPAPTPPAPTPAPAPRPAPPVPTPTPPRPTPPAPPQRQAQATPPAPARPAPPLPLPPPPLPPPPVPPPPTPAQQAGTGQTPPVQRPQERSASVLNTLERLRQQQAQAEAPRARPTPAAGAPQRGGGAPTGTAALNAGERAGLADKISECWSVDGGAVGIQNIIVEFRVEVDAGGTVRNVRPNGSPPAEPRARAVYEAARRALLDPRCNPLPLPRERLAALRDTVFRFNPRDLGLR